MTYNRFIIFFTAFIFMVSLSPESIVAAEFEAFIEPNKVIDLSAPHRDRIAKLRIKEGDVVKKGDVVAELNSTVLEAQLKRARQEALFKGAVNAASASVTMWQNRVKLLKQLQKSGNVQPQELQVARNSLAVSRAELQIAKEAQSKRELETTVIAAQLAEKQLTSPIDGLVAKINLQEGELIGGDSKPLMTLIQLQPLRAIFHLPPDVAYNVKQGEELSLSVDNNMITAKVNFIAPLIDSQSNTVEVHFLIDNSSGTLIAGKMAIFRSPLKNREEESE